MSKFKWPEGKTSVYCLDNKGVTYPCSLDFRAGGGNSKYPIVSPIGRSWTIDGQYRANGNDPECNLIHVLTDDQAARYVALMEEIKDPVRKPVAKDWVVWIGSDGYLKNGEVLQVKSVTSKGMVFESDDDDGGWIWCEYFRFATPEEEVAAKKPAVPAFQNGVYSVTLSSTTLYCTIELKNGNYHQFFGDTCGITGDIPDLTDTKLLAPLPTIGYKWRLVKMNEKIPAGEYLLYDLSNPEFGWKRYSHQTSITAHGIEGDCLYAFPEDAPEVPVAPGCTTPKQLGLSGMVRKDGC